MVMKNKKNKNIFFIENYIRYHTPSLNWRKVVDGIESTFISYYFKNSKRAKLDIRIKIQSKHLFVHRIYVYINDFNVHTFISWGLSYLSLSILNERLDLFIAKKKYDKKKSDELLLLFMESEGYKDGTNSKESKVSKKFNN